MITSVPQALLATSLFLSLVIALFLPLRPVLRRGIGSQWLCALWLILLVRLLIPLPLETHWGLINRWSNTLAATAETASPWKFSVTYPPKTNGDDASISLPARAPGSPATSRTTMRIYIPLAIWLAGLLASVALLAWRRRQTGLLAARALPATDPRLLALYSSIPANLRRNVILRETDAVQVPTLSGILRPQIWMPRSWLAHFSDDELRRILLHELGHARRGDLAVQWLFALAQCLHWFNPLVWLAARAAQLDREMACDAWVLARYYPGGSDAYGATLLKTVQLLRVPICAPAASVAMASSRQNLRARIAGIGAFRPARTWPGLLAIAAMLAMMALLTTSAQTPNPSPSATPAAGAPVASPQPPASQVPGPAGGDDSGSAVIKIGLKFVDSDYAAWKTLCAKYPDLTKISATSAPSSDGSTALDGTPPDAATQVALNAVAPGKWVLKKGAWETASNTTAIVLSILTDAQFQAMLRFLAPLKGIDLLSAPWVTVKDGQSADLGISQEMHYASAWEPYKAAPSGVSPTAFETRNTGVMLNIGAHLSGHGPIDLDMAPEVTDFIGFLNAKYGLETGAVHTTGSLGTFQQPMFSTYGARIKTEVPMGSTVLLGLVRTDPGGIQAPPGKDAAHPNVIPDALGPRGNHSIFLIFVTAKIEGGEVLAINSGWHFVVLNLGDRDGAKVNTEMVLMRDNTRVGRVRITSVEPSTSVADIVPGSVPDGIKVRPGDRAVTDSPSPSPSPASKPKDPNLPSAIPVNGKPGFVTSPYAPDKGMIDVRGFSPGDEVKDPYTGKNFLVPSAPDANPTPTATPSASPTSSSGEAMPATIADWEAVLKKDPNSWQAHNHIGSILYLQGNIKDAYPHFLEAVRLNPDNPESHNNLALALFYMNQKDAAIEQFQAGLKLKDDPSIDVNLANAYEQANQFDDAVKVYRHAIQLDPANAAAHVNLGYTLMRQGKADDAIPEFQKAKELDPKMPQAEIDLEQALRMYNNNPPATDSNF